MGRVALGVVDGMDTVVGAATVVVAVNVGNIGDVGVGAGNETSGVETGVRWHPIRIIPATNPPRTT